MTSAKKVFNSNGEIHTSRPNYAQIRRKPSADMRNNLVEVMYLF